MLAGDPSTGSCYATPSSLKLWGCVNRSRNFVRIRGSSSSVTSVLSAERVDLRDEDEIEADFGRKFRLPHISDVFPDLEPLPTTFSVKSSYPLPDYHFDDESKDLKKMYVHNDDRVLLKVIEYVSPTSAGADCEGEDCKFRHLRVWRAGPRKKIYIRPEEVKAAIVTCGGLCPGLNDVIRQIVFTLDKYGVKNIVGIPYGYRGFFDDSLSDINLTTHYVQNIHLSGGSLLGVSRGGGQTSDIVDSLEKRGINMLFVLGGNGTHAGANAIHDECWRRKMKVMVVCVPKTIDNDILLMDKTFGFDTAVEAAQRAISAAYIEARSAYHGIGVVKLMGRQSGFIAQYASLASGHVNACLIPEVPFTLHGPNGLLVYLEHLIHTQGSAVVCIAEGAGQELLPPKGSKDASGNPVLSDTGVYLQQQIKNHFIAAGTPADVKYIDPTYMIRACQANSSDSILCTVLGQNAVHGAFAGFSGITVGLCNTHYAYFPIPQVIDHPRRVDPSSRMWHRCITSTGQPDFTPRA
ncbi:hypothetical protein SELMODRAFT_100675 [Selaginella moellendorffii]|uniref:ATP-dependent 6-phosphofructokinase n=2 Tax=Selaginella moellendorffii TaxID=88036 RepID=D8RSR2_SELML|nr:hypothetical protein SELMODRAFT_100675 [Selaginella moellendorffii]